LRKKQLFLIIVLCGLALAGCDQGATNHPGITEVSTPEYGDTFIEASIGDASTLLPVLASDSASSSINGLVYFICAKG